MHTFWVSCILTFWRFLWNRQFSGLSAFSIALFLKYFFIIPTPCICPIIKSSWCWIYYIIHGSDFKFIHWYFLIRTSDVLQPLANVSINSLWLCLTAFRNSALSYSPPVPSNLRLTIVQAHSQVYYIISIQKVYNKGAWCQVADLFLLYWVVSIRIYICWECLSSFSVKTWGIC